MTGMTELLAECDCRGIRLRANGEGGLTIDAPDDVLTPDLLEQLKVHKEALLAVLSRSYDCPSQNQGQDERSRNSENMVGLAPLTASAGTDMHDESDLMLDWSNESEHLKQADVCHCCRGRRWWRSVFGRHLICGLCHPPAFPSLVAEWVETATE